MGQLKLALLAALALSAAPAIAQEQPAPSVRAGVEAWQSGNYDAAIRQWRPLADQGDADAQYNLAQAYKLGRGVPLNMNLAEQWYERAARQGHAQAGANLGLILFQNGRRREAIPYIERAAAAGDPRAEYVLGTALFNGDVVARDWPRAYALMQRAAAEGLPPAVQQLAQMEQHISAEDRTRGTELAAQMARAAPQMAATGPEPEGPRGRPRAEPERTRIAQAELPPSAAEQRPRPAPPRPTPPRAAPPPPARPAEQRAAPALASAGGRWRIQLGAFNSEAAAHSAWGGVAVRLRGLSPSYSRAGALTRLQAGPLGSRAAAVQACAAARIACIPVAP